MQTEQYDAVVCGGGPAGVAAAIAAARHGAHTLIIEQTGAFGGLGTQGLVPCFAPFSWRKDHLLIRGIGWEIVERLRSISGAGDGAWIHTDPEKLKLLFDRMLSESGVIPALFTTLTGAEVADGAIASATAYTKSGARTLRAKAFIDCTGDADLAHLAGCPTEKGDSDGRMQAASLCFVLAGVDVKAFEAFRESIGGGLAFRQFIHDSATAGKLHDSDRYQHLASAVCPREESGLIYFNYGHLYDIDGTDDDSLTQAMMLGRELVHDFVSFARSDIPGMANAVLMASGTLPGIRETRRIVGDFVLEESAFTQGRTHDDDIALYDYPVDLHDTSHRTDDSSATNPFLVGGVREIASKITYGIPYRTLLPKGVNNLLVAGRCISSDRPIQGSARVMPACFATGQAAGTAAAMRSHTGEGLAEIDVEKLRETLLADGAYLTERDQ
jgi:FAD dependent oxidoreductase